MKRIRCMVYSRVVGFITPVQNWNLGKKAEWAERKTFNVAAALAHERMEEGNEPTD